MQVLQGSLVALITPMLKNGDIDYVALERLIDWHIDMGTNGIVSVGTTGESATLDFEEHFNVISHTINYVKKKSTSYCWYWSKFNKGSNLSHCKS